MDAHIFELQTLLANSCVKNLAVCFLGSKYFAQRCNRLLTKMGKKNLAVFLATQVTLLAKFWGYIVELESVFGSNVPLTLLIDP